MNTTLLAVPAAPAVQPHDLGMGRLFWSVRDALVVGDADTGAIALWNPAAEELFGYSADEAVGLSLEALVPERLRGAHRARLAQYRATGHGRLIDSSAAVELPALRKSGEEFTVELRLSALDPPEEAKIGGRFVLAMIRDVSERKRLEAERLQLIEAQAAQQEIAQRTRAEAERARLTRQIEREQATLAAVMASMSDGVVVLDSTGRIQYLNDRAAELMGVDSQALVGKTDEEALALLRGSFANTEGKWTAWQQALTRVAARPSFEVKRVKPTPCDILVQLFPVAGAGPAVGILLRDVTGARQLALLEERERIAMDLHDGVIQSLYGVALGLGARERTLNGSSAQTREALGQAVAQINAVIQQIRNCIFDLRPPEPSEQSLRAALEGLAEELRIQAVARPELELDAAADGLLSPESATHLLHVAREAASNVIRHASASAVTIRLTRYDHTVALAIRDNGRGFDPQRAGAGTGHGLRNMAERAKALGGHLRVVGEPGRGTEVRLEVPVRQDR